jgi:hypothetical protein
MGSFSPAMYHHGYRSLASLLSVSPSPINSSKRRLTLGWRGDVEFVVTTRRVAST